jgi:hypothetical protein
MLEGTKHLLSLWASDLMGAGGLLFLPLFIAALFKPEIEERIRVLAAWNIGRKGTLFVLAAFLIVSTAKENFRVRQEVARLRANAPIVTADIDLWPGRYQLKLDQRDGHSVIVAKVIVKNTSPTKPAWVQAIHAAFSMTIPNLIQLDNEEAITEVITIPPGESEGLRFQFLISDLLPAEKCDEINQAFSSNNFESSLGLTLHFSGRPEEADFETNIKWALGRDGVTLVEQDLERLPPAPPSS